MKPLVIDPANFLDGKPDHPEELLEDIIELAECDPEYRHVGRYASDVEVSVAEVEAWNRLLRVIATKLFAGQPFTLQTPSECCAFTTVLDALDIDIADCLECNAPGSVLSECVHPLCAFADQDEDNDPARYDNFEPDEIDRLAPWEPPPVRHALRTWRVTVTLEVVIDRTDHDCDPDKCPLEVTLRKRVMFKKVRARTRTAAEERALDRFEKTHKTREGFEYWADAVCLSRPALEVCPR